MKRTDWQAPASGRVTVRLDDDDATNLETIRREALGRSRVRLAMSCADAVRHALRVAATATGAAGPGRA